jgi:hypothetical protein
VSRAPSRAARLGLAAALLLGAEAAGAQTLPTYTRTTTCDPSLDSLYYQHGRALWWPGTPPTVTWWLHSGSVPAGCGDLATLDALTAASFSSWAHRTSPTTGNQSGFSFAHTSANQTADPSFGVNGRNLVTWRKGLCSAIASTDPCHARDSCPDDHNCWDSANGGPEVLALTWVSFLSSTGQITHADMELNEWNGLTAGSAGYSYTCSAAGAPACACTAGRAGCASASTACVWADVGSIVTHEAGHVLGLDHPASGCRSTCDETMAPRIAIGDTSKRTLEPEDVKGVCAIYPGNGAAATLVFPTACQGGSSSPSIRSSQGCGCGGDPTVALWALLGPLLLLRRRGR